MTQFYKIEHFMVCGLAVAAVKAPDDCVLQAWVADKDKNRMVRDASLIADIESDSRTRPMSKTAFDAYCARHDIETNIPAAAIARTLALHRLPSTKEARSPANAFRGPAC